MDLKRALKNTRDEYLFKSNSQREETVRAELAFISMLDHFFKNAPGTDALFSKRKLNILDVGCSTMPYAFSLKTFFEKFKLRREVCILGIDTGISTAFAELDIINSGVKGITIKNLTVQALKRGGFDVVTCFNLCSLDTKGFLKRIYELLDKDGLFLISFDMKDEFKFHEQEILDAGFEITYTEENPFESMMSAFFFNNRVMCAARKKG